MQQQPQVNGDAGEDAAVSCLLYPSVSVLMIISCACAALTTQPRSGLPAVSVVSLVLGVRRGAALCGVAWLHSQQHKIHASYQRASAEPLQY